MTQGINASVGARGSAQTGWLSACLWLTLSCAALLGVLALNGTPLFYFDTAGYLGHGDGIFRVLGLFQDAPSGDGTTGDATNGDGIVIGSRSAVYAILLTFFVAQTPLWSAAIAQALGLIATLALTAHYARRLSPTINANTATLTSAMLFAGALGSAGFYVAYLMPDIFAPILLVAMAALVGFAPVLGLWGATGFVILGIGAVVMHPSHLAISLVMLPFCVVTGFLVQTGHMLRTTLLLALIPMAGIAERQAFNFAVTTRTDSEVVYLPFFTARLLSDGPGMVFLAANCPSDTWATCALFDVIDRPEQLSPDRILFSTNPETASFALLPTDTRKAIADEQRALLRATILGHPFTVIRAALGNTGRQLTLNSPVMTLPNDSMIAAVQSQYTGFPDALTTGRLINNNPTWIDHLARVQQVYYAAAALALAALTLLPQSRLHVNLRVFGLLIVFGIAANAFVTGAISQPADRYGARVIFLLPVTALLLWSLRHRPKTRGAQ